MSKVMKLISRKGKNQVCILHFVEAVGKASLILDENVYKAFYHCFIVC